DQEGRQDPGPSLVHPERRRCGPEPGSAGLCRCRHRCGGAGPGRGSGDSAACAGHRCAGHRQRLRAPPGERREAGQVGPAHDTAPVPGKGRGCVMGTVQFPYGFGSLSLLPDDTHATTEMVASFYEVGVEAVKSLVKDHREELENNGYRVLRGQDYKDFVRSFEDPANLIRHPKARSVALFNRKTILNVGMLLTESDVARKVRAYLLSAEALTRSPGHDTAPVPGEGRGCIIGVVPNHLGEGYPMSDVTVFSHESFGQVRHVMIDGEPWFIASDVCTVLDISQTHRALASLDDDEKGRHSMTTPGGVQQVSIVNESGLYSLILRSRKPHAKAFKKWVTSEVLPAIRKTGRYEAKQLDEIEVAERYLAALKAKRALEQANAKLSEELSIAAPKVDKWEKFMNSDGLIGMSELGGVLGMSAV